MGNQDLSKRLSLLSEVGEKIVTQKVELENTIINANKEKNH